MKLTSRHSLAVLLFIGLASYFYFRGLSAVPFHPDEQTQLYMSGDLERFLTNPSQLFWNPLRQNDLRQKYRLRDAPLTRWLIGVGRQIFHLPAPQVDWDWTKDWQANRSAAALPNRELLFVARWSVAIYFPFSLWLMFEVARSIGGNLSGWLGMIFLASQALILLHTRRAMAESILLFSILLTLKTIITPPSRPYWIAIPAALAFNAKQSAAPLAILCFGVAIGSPSQSELSLQKRMGLGFLYGLIFAMLTIALNPVLWSNPWRASLAAWQERTALVEEQERAIRRVNPELVWESYPQRIFGITAHLYFAKPAIADLENYLKETQAAQDAYFSQPFHALFRSLWGGAIFLILSLFGFVIAPIQARSFSRQQQRLVWLMIAATLVETIGLVAFVSIPFQRYVVPLIPFQCLWAAKGAEGIIQMIRELFQK